MNRNWWILLGAAVVIVLVIAGYGMGKDSASPAGTGQGAQPAEVAGAIQVGQEDEAKPKKGAVAPSFTLTMLDSDKTYQVGGARDKVLLLNFWASWCGPCDIEAPDLVALYHKYGDKMDLYAVNATSYDRVRNAREFVQEKGLPFPVLMDEEGEAVSLYRVYALPTSFIIDRDGKIVERIEGIIPLEQWEKLLEPVL